MSSQTLSITSARPGRARPFDVTMIPIFQVRPLDHAAPLAGTTLNTTALVAEWQQAIRQGKPTQAAFYRRASERFDDQSTWEDAEWQ